MNRFLCVLYVRDVNQNLGQTAVMTNEVSRPTGLHSIGNELQRDFQNEDAHDDGIDLGCAEQMTLIDTKVLPALPNLTHQVEKI